MERKKSGSGSRNSSVTCFRCDCKGTKANPIFIFSDTPICLECAQEQAFQMTEIAQGLREACQAQLHRPLDGAAAEDAVEAVQEEVRVVPSPREIKAYLDEYVIGQDETKKVLSVAVHNHYKRIFDPSAAAEDDGVELEKSNVLLLGPTGSGKTLLARTLARFLNVPFAIADATAITEAGYVGEDVESILLALIRAADMDIAKAEKGIIFVDEIDKIARKTGNVSITRDVSGEGVQQALLKIIEGTVSHVPPAGGRKHPEQKLLEINTRDILFICGGAFVGLDKIIERRTTMGSFGFRADKAEEGRKTTKAEPEDFIEFGLIPEFIGRLPVVTALNELTEEDLMHILTEPKNSLVKQYTKFFRLEKIALRFEPEAIRAIAHEAVIRKTGARGLRAIMESLMVDTLFEAAPDSKAPVKERKLCITAEMVRDELAGKRVLTNCVK